MYHSNIEIKEGAFIISDAHYSHFRPHFLDFIKDIYLKKLKPTQLIFMGDIFDILFYQIPYSQEINKEAIRLINEISKEIEIIYLEGNHDFNLAKIFPKVKVFTISQQPVACRFNSLKVLLAHGDFGSVLQYRIYTAIIRNPLTLYFLRMVDTVFNHIIIKKLDNYLNQKDDCKGFTGFKNFVFKRVGFFSCDYFIEGHFHQNKSFAFERLNYINLGAFACKEKYFVVNSLDSKKLLKECSFFKGDNDG